MYYKMNPDVKKQWLKMLRSGKIEQTQKVLREGDKMCCLGVLCNVHAEANPAFAQTQKSTQSYGGQSQNLPRRVQQWSGLIDYKAIQRLVTMNDYDEASFHQIANYIEANL